MSGIKVSEQDDPHGTKAVAELKAARHERLLRLVLDRHKAGDSNDEIAAWSGIPSKTVSYWIRKMGLRGNRRREF